MSYVVKRNKPALIPNVYVIGNPDIRKGKISIFGTSNYLRLPYAFEPGNQPWEMHWVFKTGNDIATPLNIFAGTSPNIASLTVFIKNGKIYSSVGTGGSTWALSNQEIASISTNIEYSLIVEFTGKAYRWHLNGALRYTYTSSVPIGQMRALYIGVSRSIAEPFIGQYIDLNRCYIKINGKFFWQGYKYNAPNYSINGIPYISKTGNSFSYGQNNFILSNDVFNPGSNTWEIMLFIKYVPSDEAQGIFITCASSDSAGSAFKGTISAYGLQIHIRNKKLALYVSSTGNSWNVANEAAGVTQFDNNQRWLYLKLVFTGRQYILYSSETGEFSGEEITEVTVNSALPIYPRYFMMGCNGSNIANPFLGNISLSQSYIKINDKDWWTWQKTGYEVKSYVAKRKKISIPQGTFKPNYTVVGSPTVNNGVVSGFSTSNYLKLPNVFKPVIAPWEVVFKVNVTDYSNGGIIFGQRNGGYFYIRTEATGVFVTGHSNTILNGTTQIVLGKDYWVKARHDETKLYLELSEDGINYTEENSVAISSTFTPSSDPQYVGLWYNTYANGLHNTFNGSIDLKESYIKNYYGIQWNCKYNENVYDIISYVAKRKIRRYYKYKYEDWQQPNFTGYTTDGAVVSATSEDTGDGRFAWKALQTSTQPAANTSDNYGKNNTSTAVWKVKFPYLLKISKIEHQARNWNNSVDYNTVGAYYADEAKTKKIGDVNSPSSGAWTSFNVDYLTDTILLDMTGGGSWSGIGRLKITAQKANPVEVSADDYTPVTEGFTSSFSGITCNLPVVTQVGSSDLYKVYWEHLKGTSGTYTEPAYTSYIKKTEFDALANENLLTQYNEDGSLLANPKPMYKVNQYLTSGESYRIGSPDYFFVDEITS